VYRLQATASFGAPNVRRRQEGASTSVVISVKLQKATILTAAGAHIHVVQNDRNWTEGVMVVGR
ncbi:hypothetical protein K443DRAFT_686615, partial [Laccaria amethystina LaAM-08-1]